MKKEDALSFRLPAVAAACVVALFLVPPHAGAGSELSGGAEREGWQAAESRYSVSFGLLSASRAAREHDDTWHVPNSSGTLVLNETTFAFSWKALPSLDIELRAGWAELSTSDFDPAYNWSMSGAFALGFGIRERLVWTGYGYELPFELTFDYSGFDTDSGLIAGDVEMWSVGCRALLPVNEWACYAGLRYSDITFAYSHPSDTGKRLGGFDASDNVGISLGARRAVLQNLFMECVVHLLDETGVLLRVGCSF